jgi:hypothetical protein
MEIIREQGLLIHASVSLKYARLCKSEPFKRRLAQIGELPYGKIIGWVKLGKIITTETWINKYKPDVLSEDNCDEFLFGDYTPNRWAWEILEPVQWEFPIETKGSLSLWDYEIPSLNAKSPVL